MHRPTDPRSPIQSQRSRSCLPFVAAAFAALAFWTWQNSDSALDWVEEQSSSAPESREPATAPETMREPDQTVELPSPADEQAIEYPRKARANLVQLFSTNDYPAEAIRNNEQGTVAFELSINRLGWVSGCRIVESSGSKALDRATCNILSSRARFEPARDESGKRITDQYKGKIRWELPEG